ncbi:hypothetical protein K360107B91_42490 [Enterocloster bolteae]
MLWELLAPRDRPELQAPPGLRERRGRPELLELLEPQGHKGLPGLRVLPDRRGQPDLPEPPDQRERLKSPAQCQHLILQQVPFL